MAKPSEVPTWATTGTIVTPSSGKRATGWVTGEKAPAQWFNWYMNSVGQWCTWLNGLQDEALTWTGINTYDAGIVLKDSSSLEALASFNVKNSSTWTFNNVPTFNAGGTIANSTLAGSGTGSFSVGASGDFTYNPARTEYEIVPGIPWAEWTYTGTQPTVSGGTAIYAVDGANAYITNNTGGGYWTARVRLPKGATIVSLEFGLMNLHATAIAVVGASLMTNTRRASGVGGFTQLFDNGIVFNADLNVAANTSTATWVNCTPITTQVMPSDGWARASVYFKTTNGATAVDGNVRCYGMRVGYTINKVARSG